MDPLGFGLENFDSIGRWRNSDGAFPVDALGELPDGRSFNGPVALVGTLRSGGDDFLRCLTTKLATYALGRPMAPEDRPMLQGILDSLDEEVPTLAQVIAGIILSEAFSYME